MWFITEPFVNTVAVCHFSFLWCCTIHSNAVAVSHSTFLNSTIAASLERLMVWAVTWCALELLG